MRILMTWLTCDKSDKWKDMFTDLIRHEAFTPDNKDMNPITVAVLDSGIYDEHIDF